MYFEVLWRFCLVPLLLLAFCETLYASYSYPTKVVGVFRTQTSAPATAASLAVDNFNKISDVKFSYSNVELDCDDEELAYLNIKYDFHNSLIVTGCSSACEELATNLTQRSFQNSFLMCYGFPTANTLEVSRSPENLYLAQPNPKALVPSLFKLVKLLAQLIDVKSTRVYVLLSNQDDMYGLYRQTALHLFNNLGHNSIKSWVTLIQEEPQPLEAFLANVPDKRSEDINIIVAMVEEKEARNLLCHIHKKNSLRLCEKYLVIFAGQFRKSWLYDTDEEHEEDEDQGKNEYSCKIEQLLAAAEGHFLLDIPNRNIESADSFIFNSTLIKELQKNKEGIRKDFEEAPLAYDSVWAIIRAISSYAKEEDGSGIGENHNLGGIAMEKLGEPFIGHSGNFSFNNEKRRNANESVIAIHRFENGSYDYLGQHFNTNSSFVWSKHPLSQEMPNSPCSGSDLNPAIFILLTGTLYCYLFYFFGDASLNSRIQN